MTAQEIRQKYIKYMADCGHQVIPRAQLVPQEDATTLFTGSGMQPLMPYLLGAPHPAGKRLVNSQVCLRAQDIEEVGDNRHTTCFEMLGNWSLGDYFKQDQLRWFFEFLLDVVGLEVDRLYASCFIGDDKRNIPKDTQAAEILVKLYEQRGIKAKVVDLGSAKQGDKIGLKGGRIFFYDDAENWWSRAGGIDQTPLGDPAGGDCEFFYDFGPQTHDESKWGLAHPANDSGRFLEIGNSVFMEYQRTESGFVPLANQNVDFGGGLERIAAAALGVEDVFKVSLLAPIVREIETLSGQSYEKNPRPMRIIADHLRAASWLAVDGVRPSNKEQGYVMRRLMRRALRFGLEIGIEQGLSQRLLPVVAEIYAPDYPEFNIDPVIEALTSEERVFRQTLRSGVREFAKLTQNGRLGGADLFKLYDTYGFPVELSLEEAASQAIVVEDEAQADFQDLMNAQKKRSKTAASGDYKGGLADHNPMTVKYHTATHLMYRALKNVLGDQVVQRGSNITQERLRFDFSYEQKLSNDQIAQVEQMVNEQIDRDWPMSWREEVTDEALAAGVLGAFGDKYGDKVKVYTVGDPDGEHYSREICGGPHVSQTGHLGQDGCRFKIIKEESSSAGVRRIKAVLAN